MAIGCILAACMSAGGQPLYQMTPGEIGSYLENLDARGCDFARRVQDVALCSLGTPYARGPLGEGPDGEYDTDPLADFARVDCVTFVEQTLALAAARSYDEAVSTLQQIRYKDGLISYEARNHFMVTDWIANNHFCRDVTGALGVPLAHVTRRISREGFFERVNAPGLGQDTPDKDVTLGYIPLAQAEAAEAVMPTPSLVVFIGKIDWLFALHCGLFVPDAGGHGVLVHASSQAGQVIAADFSQHCSENSRYLGFIVCALERPGIPAAEPAPKAQGEEKMNEQRER